MYIIGQGEWDKCDLFRSIMYDPQRQLNILETEPVLDWLKRQVAGVTRRKSNGDHTVGNEIVTCKGG